MLLTPKMCVFRVKERKCLRFLVDKRGIKANPDKIKAVNEIKSLGNVREVQRANRVSDSLQMLLLQVS